MGDIKRDWLQRADEITRLRAENERLRERLVAISEYGHLSGESLAYMATRALTDQEGDDGKA